jgi:hypothetical protein
MIIRSIQLHHGISWDIPAIICVNQHVPKIIQKLGHLGIVPIAIAVRSQPWWSSLSHPSWISQNGVAATMDDAGHQVQMDKARWKSMDMPFGGLGNIHFEVFPCVSSLQKIFGRSNIHERMTHSWFCDAFFIDLCSPCPALLLRPKHIDGNTTVTKSLVSSQDVSFRTAELWDEIPSISWDMGPRNNYGYVWIYFGI